MSKRPLQMQEPADVRHWYEAEPGVKRRIPRNVLERRQRHESQSAHCRDLTRVGNEKCSDASPAEIRTNVELSDMQRRAMTLGEHESYRSIARVLGDPQQRSIDRSAQSRRRHWPHEVRTQDARSKSPCRFQLDARKRVDVARPRIANANDV